LPRERWTKESEEKLTGRIYKRGEKVRGVKEGKIPNPVNVGVTTTGGGRSLEKKPYHLLGGEKKGTT